MSNATATMSPDVKAMLEAMKAQMEAAEKARLEAERVSAELRDKLAKGKAQSPFSNAAEFTGKATEIKLADVTGNVTGKPRVFSTGSYGWNLNGKAKITVDGVEVLCQFSGNVIVIGSKPDDATATESKAKF